MSVTVELPQLGESVVEGTIARWLVREGESVKRDQPLVEVTTDKVDAEIPSPEDGVVEKILVAEGETVAVGTALLRLAAGTQTAGAAAGRGKPEASAGERGAGTPAAPARQASDAAAQAPEVRATPAARRLAEAEGVSLAAATATGPGGRVSKADVERARVAKPAASTPAAAEPDAAEPAAARSAVRAPEAAAGEGGETRAVAAFLPAGGKRPPYLSYQLQPGDRLIPMTPLRRIVAEHMVLSKQLAPHVGTVAEVDMHGVVKLRDAHKRAFQEAHGFGLTYLPFIVHAAVQALREFPRLNASVLEDAIVEKKAIHVGVAVETEKGLVVPVVRQAERLSLLGLAEAIEDLSSRARAKRLSPDELRGGTFTVSNPGRHGNLYGFAIINQPQVGILRMGEIVRRPVVRELDGAEAIVIRPILHLALSYDHRAVDGAPANAFLHHVRTLLEGAAFEL
ncbi:MAG: dihydrolipoamide acetyltransferase family protein [Deltaproteobacteria bacterium]|nr:dihydrolipoamide acetyltransferase family protein [Deltaproteobacteria bacterium]